MAAACPDYAAGAPLAAVFPRMESACRARGDGALLSQRAARVLADWMEGCLETRVAESERAFQEEVARALATDHQVSADQIGSR